MKKLNSLVAASALALTFGLTACGSSDSDKKADAGTPAANSSQAAATATGSSGATAKATATGGNGLPDVGGVNNCTLKRKDKELKATAVGVSCDDSSKIWDKFDGKDQDIATSDVEYDGDTFKCAIMASGDTVSGGCTVGGKAISITSV